VSGFLNRCAVRHVAGEGAVLASSGPKIRWTRAGEELDVAQERHWCSDAFGEGNEHASKQLFWNSCWGSDLGFSCWSLHAGGKKNKQTNENDNKKPE
jgi:hypothetical protein